MRKAGVLSDKYFKEVCTEFHAMKPGLAQKLFPYQIATQEGLHLPKHLPVAQRGYTLNQAAMYISNHSREPYEMILQNLIDQQRKEQLSAVKQIVPRIEYQIDDQISLCAVKMKPRETDFQQLGRTAYVAPSGSVVPKTGPLATEFTAVSKPEEPTGQTAPAPATQAKGTSPPKKESPTTPVKEEM